MDLTRVETAGTASAPVARGEASADAGKGERKILFYRNPMNPSITSKAPARDEMGMDYVPVYEDEVGGGAAADTLPEGYSSVQVGMERVQLAGIQSAVAVRETIRHPVRAVGVVVPDERRVRRVQAKIEGWIEKLYVNFTGQYVEKGQPFLEIYSPDLVASQREYLLARANESRMKESPYEDAREMASALTQAAHSRLKLFDVPERFIEELEKTGKVRRTVPPERAGIGLRDRQGRLRGHARRAGNGSAHRHGSLPRLDRGGPLRIRGAVRARGTDGDARDGGRPGNEAKGQSRLYPPHGLPPRPAR